MKNILIYVLVTIFSITLFSCKESEKERKQKSIDLMSSRTLGLGYLEDFKLEKAEKEFLKFIKLAPKEKLGYANLGLTYLRMGKYVDAEKQLFKAIKIDPKDANVKLLLATVYQMNNERKKAISVLVDALKLDPDHLKILYKLSELYAVDANVESKKQRKKYILHLVEKAPGNLVPLLSLIEIYIREGNNDKAIEKLEIARKQFPAFPKEAIPFFNKTLSLLKKQDSKQAIIQFTIFNNYLKLSFPYQEGMKKLKGPGGALVGFPLITFDQQSETRTSKNSDILDAIKFTEITSSAGLDIVPKLIDNTNNKFQNSTHVVAADYNGDGNTDLYISTYDATSSTYKHYLFNNDGVNFKDVAKNVGIKKCGKEASATFADFDNDGFLDLYIVSNDGDKLYRNFGKGIFKDITDTSKIGSQKDGNKGLFFDIDHDGDLDLFEATEKYNLVFRNNGDGTFLEQAKKMGVAGEDNENTSDAAFGDFDDDGDIDLIVVNKNANNRLYSNQRQGIFKDITKISGLKNNDNSTSVAVGDYNNDGFLDMFITSLNGENSTLYRNLGHGSFEAVKTKNMFSALNNIHAFDVKFFDFDNDGFLDIIIAGKSKQKDSRGVLLYHNNGNGKFKDVSNLLPASIKDGNEIALIDYNNDGDIDVVITGVSGGVYLLRNDGGNINHYVNMKLVGLRAGSAKNNYFGIGAKVEIRSGNLYQTSVVTNQNVHFGLGNRSKADIIRITWTNGVPQNIFLPGADQALIEAQTLKGSCPFLYTWNGKKYVFAKDIIWRSALGMPLGIMGGNMKRAFPNASDDYIKINGNLLKPKNGKYSIQVTSELWETIYIDKIQLLAVDHPDSIAIYVPEQFSPPPFPGLKIYQVQKKYFPVSVTDSKGSDLLPFIVKKDNKYVHNFESGKYQGVTTMHDLILDPGKAGYKDKLFIFLNGWIFPTDASINVALSQSDKLKSSLPIIQVINKKGQWQTVINNLGFPMGKNKTVIVELTGKFLSADHRVRILTNMEIYWDQIFFSNENTKSPLNLTSLNIDSADIHYRGFSKSYRKGGRYGPHWFDYYTVDKNTKWRDLSGNYTRYGDVKPLLTESDNQYIISNAGDETSITFDTKNLPKLKKGWKRDFLIHSVGWVKDGDINTALGNKVLPLPFHGMSSYPPSKKDIYPNTPELINYQNKYNTRVVNTDNFKNSIKKVN